MRRLRSILCPLVVVAFSGLGLPLATVMADEVPAPSTTEATSPPPPPDLADPPGSPGTPEADRRDGRLRLAWFPVLMASPETGVGFGAGLLFTFRPDGAPPESPPQTLPFIAIQTTKAQTILSFQPELYLDAGRWRLSTSIGYSNFPDSFYGIGNDTKETDQEDFAFEQVLFRPVVLRQVVPALLVGAHYDFSHVTMLEREAGGLLDPSVPPVIVGSEGGFLSGFGPVVVVDRRNHVFYPTRGVLARFHGSWYRGAWGSNYDYESFGADIRGYQHLGRDRVLAAQLVVTGRGGEVPFGELPKLGDLLRGVVPSRYRDHLLVLGQVELRVPLSRRFNATAFAGVGDVVPDPSDLTAPNAKFTGGLGLRWAFDPQERVFIRLDLGFGRWGVQPYFNLGEAF